MADTDSTGDPSENVTTGHRVCLMCSYAGRILPRPHDHQLRYVGGDTRIVAIPRHTSWSSLLSKLAKLSGSSPDSAPPTVKYQLPNEDLDALVSLTSDEDLENMMDEYDRLLLLSSPSRPPRLRLFLFPPGASFISSSSSSAATAFGSLLESSTSKRETWFLDALNGGASPGLLPLERGRSEASSVVSEVPDYLFGLDSNSDDPKPKSSDPGSPAVATSSPHYYSASSAPSVDISPTTTKKPEPPYHPIPNPNPNPNPNLNPNPVYYVHDSVPVYYVPSSVPVRPIQYGPVYGGPAYVGGPPTLAPAPAPARPGLAGSFEYQGGVVYPMAGVGPVGGEVVVAPPGIIGPEMRIGPTSHHYSKE